MSRHAVIEIKSPNDHLMCYLKVKLLYFVKFQATEANPNIHGVQASVTTNVQINIIDENDNTPKFYKCDDIADKLNCVEQTHFTGEILEHSLGSVPINMMVNDSDQVREKKRTMKENILQLRDEVFLYACMISSD